MTKPSSLRDRTRDWLGVEDPVVDVDGIATARSLLFHGWLLVLAGAQSYLTATDKTPAVATAQRTGTVQGALLVGAAGSWHLLTLSRSNHLLVRLLLLIYAWANWIGAQLALVTGASGNAYDRSFTCSLTNTKWMYNAVVNWLLGLSITILPAIFVITWGCYAPSSGYGQRCVWALAVSAAIVTLVLPAVIAFSPNSNVIDPNLYIEGYPESNVDDGGTLPRKRSYCPYAVMGVPPLDYGTQNGDEGDPMKPDGHPALGDMKYDDAPPFAIPRF